MIRYAVRTESAVEADVEAAFDWYEGEEPGLVFEFLADLVPANQRDSLFDDRNDSSVGRSAGFGDF